MNLNSVVFYLVWKNPSILSRWEFYWAFTSIIWIRCRQLKDAKSHLSTLYFWEKFSNVKCFRFSDELSDWKSCEIEDGTKAIWLTAMSKSTCVQSVKTEALKSAISCLVWGVNKSRWCDDCGFWEMPSGRLSWNADEKIEILFHQIFFFYCLFVWLINLLLWVNLLVAILLFQAF